MKTSRRSFVTLASAAILAPTAALARSRDARPDPPLGNARAFLAWSMDRHAELETYSSKATWELTFDGAPAGSSGESQRTIDYAAPNRFRVTHASYSATLRHTYVSDGKRLVVGTEGFGMGAQSYDAFSSFAEAGEPGGPMSHPHFGGSSLYAFFAGSKGIAALLGKKPGEPKFGADIEIAGDACKTVVFGGGTFYKERRAVIRVRDGMVLRLEGFDPEKKYTPEEIKKNIADAKRAAVAMKMPAEVRGNLLRYAARDRRRSALTVEVYSEIATDKPIAASTFDPAQIKDAPPAGPKRPAPPKLTPLEIGQPAPAFSVTRLAGDAAASDKSLRGKVVLIDFWATWCPPCRKGLPDTLAIQKKYAAAGLVVLAVSDEKAETVSAYLKAEKMTALSACLDPGRKMGVAFGVAAIPTTVILGRDGKIAAQFVGLTEKSEIEAALKKAGL